MTPAGKSWRRWTSATVAAAKYHGVLPSLHGMKCADCGKSAEVYDHRDYSKPLEVVPVCIACNFKRWKGWSPSWPYDGRRCFRGELYPNDCYAELTPFREKYFYHFPEQRPTTNTNT